MDPLPPITEDELATLPEWARALILALRARIEPLEAKVAELEARLAKNSSNSSKPPSSDPPWTPRPRGKERTGRKRGGQKGHKGHHRELLPAEECDAVMEHRPSRCIDCGTSLDGVAPLPDVSRHQVAELPERPVVVTEHRALAVVCPCCKKKNRAALPAGARRMLGPRLAAATAVLVGQHHAGRRDAQDILQSAFGVRVSLGAISEAEETVSAALEKPCEAVREEVASAPFINIDDTPFYEGVSPETEMKLCPGARVARMARKRMTRLWTMCSPTATYHRIADSRGREVVQELLAGARGIVGSDRLASFLHFDRNFWQVCWAHLRRDFEAMAERPGTETLGNLLAFETNKLFGIWRRHRSGELGFAAMQGEMQPVSERIDMVLRYGPEQFGADDKARHTCQNLADLGPALWTFTRIEGVEPTNNAAERTIRPAVRWRKRSYGTMSARGSRFAERILTISATLRQRGADVLDYLAQAIAAHLNGESPPPIPAPRPG